MSKPVESSENSFFESSMSLGKTNSNNTSTPSLTKIANNFKNKKFLDNDNRIYLTKEILNQFKSVETFLWNNKYNVQNESDIFVDDENKENGLLPTEIILEILSKSKCRKKINDYFQLTQFQNCCTLLKNVYIPFDKELNLNIVEEVENQNDLALNNILSEEIIDAEAIEDQKLVLYYCTICAFYPNLYSVNLPSPTDSTSSKISLDSKSASNETLNEFDNSNKKFTSNFEDLETTTEGLCDHIREIFNLKRHVYNEYQVKAMNRLLTQKSHPQILKEEIQMQIHVLENHLHPYYKKDNFQSELCYSIWKNRKLVELIKIMKKFEHISLENDEIKKEKLEKYIEKLNSFPRFYEKLVQQIFKNLAFNNGFRLTSNSKRLLKEFQLRYCIDNFEGLIIELKYFLKCFQNNPNLFDILVSYLRHVYMNLKMNQIQNEQQKYPILVSNLLEFISILETIHTTIVNILRDLQMFNPDPTSKRLSALLELMEELSSLNEFLNRTSSISVNDSIRIHIKIGLENLYQKTKNQILSQTISEDPLNNKKFDSNTVYSMLVFCRDQITYYKNIVSQKTFKNMNILNLVFDVVYENLMNDVKSLFEEHFDELYDQSKLNLNLLALAYRLNQFDTEFIEHVPMEKQLWRNYISPHLFNWIKTLGKISSQMIFNYFIPKDSYKEIEFQSDNYDAEFMNNFQEMINLTAKNFFDNMNIVNESGLNINQNRPKSAFKTIAHQSSSSSLSLTDNSDKKEIIKKNVIRKPLKKVYDRQRSKSLIPARTTPIPKLIKYKFSIDSSQSIESNTWSTLTKSILSLTLSNRSLLNKDRLPCSNSLTDLCILLFRYQNTCEQLLDLCMPLIYVKIQKNLFQSRFNSFNSMFQEMYQFIEIYANNILSLEVCALDKSYLGNIFGNEIKKEILSGKLDGTIWGCRHRLKNSKYNCTYFIDKNSKYISDKYEPINEEMCIRVNNVLQLKEIRNTIYLSYNQNIQKYYNYLLKMNDRQSFNLFQQFKLEVYKIKLFNRNIELKIESITNGLICLLVHRFNLFCKKAIFLLISDELDSYPVITRMKPLIDFLNCNLNMLRDKLYAKLFLKFIRNLWNAFYENFVELIKKFENESAKNPQKEAITYRKMIDILMLKFKEYTTNHGFLESKMKQLCMMLNLYSQNTNNLIFLHYKLFNFNYQKHGSSDMDPKTSNSNYFQFDLIHLVKMTKKLKKNFSGKSFINFLKKFPPELNQIGIFSKDYCINYAQRLLEANYLRSVQARKKFLRRSSNKTQNLLEFDPIEYEALAEFDCDKIYLATKSNFYAINSEKITKLTENLLFRNSLINQEIEILYPNISDANLNESKYDQESDALFNQCVENEIMDHDFITRILWHRIYDEPIVMKFISMRQSNFANNQYLNKILQRNTSNNSFDLNYPILHLV